MDLSAFNFVIVYKPAFTTTKRSICGTEKTFPEKTSILFFFLFSGLRSDISSSCRQLGAGCPNVLRRTMLEKLFRDNKRKKWRLIEVFPSFRQNCWSGYVKIQHSTPPDEQLAGKKFGNFFTLNICFYAWRTKYCSLGAKPKQVVKLCPED